MNILKQVLGRAEEFHNISRMLRNYHEPKQHDWIDERAELLIADIKSAQQGVQRIAFGAFLAGVLVSFAIVLIIVFVQNGVR